MSDYHTDVEMLEVDTENVYSESIDFPEESSMQVAVSETCAEDDFDSPLLGVGKEFLAAEEYKSSGKKKRGSYRVYSNEQIAEFINLVNNGMSQRKAAEKMHIKQRTASNYYQDIELNSMPAPRNSKEKKKTGRKPKLNEENTKHLCKVYRRETYCCA